jgi:hypothetical protein
VNCPKVLQKPYLLLGPFRLRAGCGISGAGHGTVPEALIALERRARRIDGLEGGSSGGRC